MPDLYVTYYALDGSSRSGAIWSDGPKRGSKWVANAGQFVLVKRAGRQDKHTGAWIEVSP